MQYKSEIEMIEDLFKKDWIKFYPNKKSAQLEAKKFGWSNQVFKHKRRFEVVWIIGKKEFYSEKDIFNIETITYYFPKLQYEIINGIKQQPVLKAKVIL